MEIQPIRKQKLNDLVFEEIRRLIIEGKWAPGERIPGENSLSEQFGVSRVTIRQALERLNALGLTETRPGLGRYVSVYDAGQIMKGLTPAMYLGNASAQEINDFREMLESWAAGRAAEYAGDEDIRALEDNFHSMQICMEQNNHQEFALLDLEFHMLIGRMSRNSLVSQTYTILYELLRDSFVRIVDRMGFTALEYHRPLIDAISAHDAALASQTAREHLQNNNKYL